MATKSEQIKLEATELATHSSYLTIVPELVALIQRNYGKKISSADKHKMVVQLARELFPTSYANDDIIDELIGLTFYLARSVEARKLLKKSCNCF